MSFPRLTALCAGLVLMTGAAHAASSASHVNISNTFELGVEGEYYQYREPTLDNMTGPGGGINLQDTLSIGSYFLRANVILDYFDLKYTSNGTGSDNSNSNYLQDYRFMFGGTIPISHEEYLQPYIGFGYRVLFDAGQGSVTNTGAYGYDRRSEYLYIPIGLGARFHLGGWGLLPTVEYDYFIEGYQTTSLTDLGADNDLTNKQNNGYGVRADFMVEPPINFYHFAIGPYFRYWNISNSVPETIYYGGVATETGIEPTNNTTEIGIRASVKFQ